jgi:hypothetical protein
MHELYAQLWQLKAYSRLLMRNYTHGFQLECVFDKILRVFMLIRTLSEALGLIFLYALKFNPILFFK